MWVHAGEITAGLVAGLARKRVRCIRVDFAGALVAPWPANSNGMGVAPTATAREANRSRGHRPAACGGGDGSGFGMEKVGP